MKVRREDRQTAIEYVKELYEAYTTMKKVWDTAQEIICDEIEERYVPPYRGGDWDEYLDSLKPEELDAFYAIRNREERALPNIKARQTWIKENDKEDIGMRMQEIISKYDLWDEEELAQIIQDFGLSPSSQGERHMNEEVGDVGFKNRLFLKRLDDEPGVQLFLVTENGVDKQKECLTPNSDPKRDWLCMYDAGGEYIDSIPYQTFLKLGGNVDRINAFCQREEVHSRTCVEKSAEKQTLVGCLPEDISTLKLYIPAHVTEKGLEHWECEGEDDPRVYAVKALNRLGIYSGETFPAIYDQPAISKMSMSRRGNPYKYLQPLFDLREKMDMADLENVRILLDAITGIDKNRENSQGIIEAIIKANSNGLTDIGRRAVVKAGLEERASENSGTPQSSDKPRKKDWKILPPRSGLEGQEMKINDLKEQLESVQEMSVGEGEQQVAPELIPEVE